MGIDKLSQQQLAAHFLASNRPPMTMPDPDIVQYDIALPYTSSREQDQKAVESMLDLLRAQGLELAPLRDPNFFEAGAETRSLRAGRFAYNVPILREYVALVVEKYATDNGLGKNTSFEEFNRHRAQNGLREMRLPVQLFLHKDDYARVRAAFEGLAHQDIEFDSSLLPDQNPS